MIARLMPTDRAMSSIWASRTPRSSNSRRVAEMISASRCRRRDAAVPPRAGTFADVGSVLMAVSLGRSSAAGRLWFDAGVLVAAARRALEATVPAFVPALLLAVLVGLLVAVQPPLPASAATAGGRFAGTARLPGCSGAVVRWPAALDSDRAVVLTNGHCVRQPFLLAREVLVNQRRWTRVELLDRRGRVARVARAVRLQYASMYRTDVALLTLRETYADLAGDGVTPLSLADEGP